MSARRSRETDLQGSLSPGAPALPDSDSSRRAFRPVELDFERLEPRDASLRSTEFLERMRARRSVRHFSPEAVPLDLIENAIRTAGTAPSGANQQPWMFVVIGDPAMKARIRAAAEHEERLLYERRASEEYLGALEPIGTTWQKPHLTEAPYVIAVFEQPWGYDEHGGRRKHYYVRESVGIAIGFLLASLHTAGLATLTHSPAPMDFVTRILGRPGNERALLLIPVGYPAAGATVPLLAKKAPGEICELLLGANKAPAG
jgi:nitroreductase